MLPVERPQLRPYLAAVVEGGSRSAVDQQLHLVSAHLAAQRLTGSRCAGKCRQGRKNTHRSGKNVHGRDLLAPIQRPALAKVVTL